MTDALLVDVPEACRLLGGISESMVRRMAADGRLPHIRFGRRLLFSLDGLREFIRENNGRDVAAGKEKGA